MITIYGEQAYPDGTSDSSELMTAGKLLPRGERSFVLEYEETALTGMEGTTTRIIRSGERVTLARSGTINSQMIFQEGRQHSSLYETPYGALTVDIHTARMSGDVGEMGGRMEIRYDIAVQQQVMSKNRFQIRVRRTNLLQDIRSTT